MAWWILGFHSKLNNPAAMIELDPTKYAFDRQRGIWLRAGYEGIPYSDGEDTERRIQSVVKSAADRTLHSAELRAQCTDWPSLYHLSPERSNILRPVAHRLQGRVLEIGAGCGAITRYLGETGANVLALEGSPRRASIASARVEGLENVTVLAERFDRFESLHEFDAVTLIGVLEYASMFTTAPQPVLSMLRRVRGLLGRKGTLIIAIENKLGLKYFAGAPEDHVMVPMFGVEDRYEDGGPRTFGLLELQRLLRDAGFPAVDVFAPFPDYKLPRLVLSEKGMAYPGFDAARMIAGTVELDPQLPDKLNFDLSRVWRSVAENGLGLHMANSLLLCASTDDVNDTSTDVLAWYYRQDRSFDLCKSVLFKQADANNVEVQTYRAEATKGGMGAGASASSRPYVAGKSLASVLSAIVQKRDWAMEEGTAFVSRYVSCLSQLIGERLAVQPLQHRIPGRWCVAVPDNIIVDEDGHPHLISATSGCTDDIEFGFLLWLGLRTSLAGIRGVVPPREGLPGGSLTRALLQAAGWRISDADHVRYESEEAQRQNRLGRAPWPPSPQEPAVPEDRESAFVAVIEVPGSPKAVAREIGRASLTSGRRQVEFQLGGSTGTDGFEVRIVTPGLPCLAVVHDVLITVDGRCVWSQAKSVAECVQSGLQSAKLGAETVMIGCSPVTRVALPAGVPHHSGAMRVVVDIDLIEGNRAFDVIQTLARESILGAAVVRKQEIGASAPGFSSAVAALEGELTAIRSSASWKITKPLRVISGLVRRRRAKRSGAGR